MAEKNAPRRKKTRSIPAQQMEPRAGEEEERAGKDKGRLVSLRQENLAGRQRVSEPGNATKSRGSRSSSAPHLSGRHAITGFVYMGLCATGNLGENRE